MHMYKYNTINFIHFSYEFSFLIKYELIEVKKNKNILILYNHFTPNTNIHQNQNIPSFALYEKINKMLIQQYKYVKQSILATKKYA